MVTDNSIPHSSRRRSFNKSDLRQAIRIAKQEGLSIGAIEIREGSVYLRIGAPMVADESIGDPTLDAYLKTINDRSSK